MIKKIAAWIEEWLSPGWVLVFMLGIFLFAVISSVVVFGFYASYFNEGIVKSHQAWAYFGDFVSGLLNPIFGFFGLMALLLTIIMQSIELRHGKEQLKKATESLEASSRAAQEQIAQFQNQSKKEDLFRMIKTIYEDFEGSFFSEPIILIKKDGTEIKTTPDNIFGKLKKEVHYRELPDKKEEYYKENTEALRPLAFILRDLFIYLVRYKNIAEKDFISFYYQNRLITICNDMHKKGYLPDDLAIFYCPEFLAFP